MGSRGSLPPFLFLLPALSLTKRWDLHNMHAVEARGRKTTLVKKKKSIFFAAGHERAAVFKTFQIFTCYPTWYFMPLAPNWRMGWNRQVVLACLSSTVIQFWSCYWIACSMFGAPLNSGGQNEVKVLSLDRRPSDRESYSSCMQPLSLCRLSKQWCRSQYARRHLSLIRKCLKIPASAHQHAGSLDTCLS